MDNEIKKKVKTFLKDYNIQKITVESLCSVIQKQGYTIVEYNNIYNNENVATLLNALDLEKICERSKGFTYADSKRRLVFVHEDLSYNEKLMILAHEEGHIYCNHIASAPILGHDVIEEYEANEFTHYLLNDSRPQRINQFIHAHKRSILAAILAAVIALAVCTVSIRTKSNQRYYGDFYITSTGSKYHEKNCIFVKNKKNVERLTVEQFESGEYEPCNVCLPNGG